MSFQDYVKFANDNRTCYLATVEGDQPRVRALGLFFADDTGFYFQIESVKAMNKQLQNNKKVEVYFHAAGAGGGIGQVMRVSGEVEFLDDIALKTRVLEERTFLKGLGIKGPEDPLLVIFRISKGEAYFWTMADNMKESEIERIKFGS